MALTAALMAGCAAFVAVRAMGFDIAWLGVYAVALAAALAVQLGRRGTAWTIAAAAAVVLGLALLIGRYAGDVSAMLADFRAGGSLSAEQLVQHVAAGRGVALIAALLLGALFAGLDRKAAEDFSFLLSIPSIVGGAVLEIPDALREGFGNIDWLCVAAGMLVAGVTGYFAIRLMLAAIKKRSLWGFAVYTGLLGAAILVDQFFTHCFF